MWSFCRRNPLLWILLGALAVRAGTAVWLQHRLDHVWHRSFLIPGDAAGYWELAKNLAEGKPYQVHTPPRRVHRMPGFPALLAVSIAVFGESFLAARLMLAAVGTLACGLVYLLGCEIFSRRTGLIAATLTAFSPVMIGLSVLILSETPFAALLAGSLLALAKLVKTGFGPDDRRRWIVLSLTAGAVVAAACYMRPGWLLAAPIFALLYSATADNRKQAALRAALVLSATFLVLLPWAWRNQRVTGHWVFTTLWVGPSLYDGLNPEADGSSDMSFFDRDRRQGRTAGLTEYEIDRYYRRKAWEFVVEHPGRAIQLAGIKLARFWSPWPAAPQLDHPAYRAAAAAFFLPVVGLAVVGWYRCRRRLWLSILTAGPVLYFSALHMVFVGSLRYRLPAEYPLYVLAAYGLQSLFGSRTKPSH